MQLDTYQNNSYLGNPGLCGFPLPDCGFPYLGNPGEHSASSSPSTSSAPSTKDGHKGTELLEWKAILMGYVTGIFFGFFGGYYLYLLGKPVWLMRLIYKAEFMLMEQRKKHTRRYQRKKSAPPLPILTKSPPLLSLFLLLVSLHLLAAERCHQQPYRHKPPLSRGGAPLTTTQIWFRSSPLHCRPGLVTDLDFTFCKEFLLMVLMICGEVFDVIGVVVA
ncbi:hypothetical protein Droror1_Dr00014898 [Drosera rotundifolia]